MDAAKIQLSEEELQLVQNAGILLTKNSIIGKVYALFGELSENWQILMQSYTSIPASVLANAPKISRGENYESLPYVMLDYPRMFGKTAICAIRTFFWWGHFFSITLQLKGQWQERTRQAILRDYEKLVNAGFYIAISTNEWRHDFEDSTSVPLKDLSKKSCEGILHEHPFCKLSAKVSLQQWDAVQEHLDRHYRILLELLK